MPALVVIPEYKEKKGVDLKFTKHKKNIDTNKFMQDIV